jgi:hypothetical protein
VKKGLLGTEVLWLGCELAGDWGDRDLQGALATFWGDGRRVALCAFGHMHHNLNDGTGGTRQAVNVCYTTVFHGAFPFGSFMGLVL